MRRRRCIVTTTAAQSALSRSSSWLCCRYCSTRCGSDRGRGKVNFREGPPDGGLFPFRTFQHSFRSQAAFRQLMLSSNRRRSSGEGSPEVHHVSNFDRMRIWILYFLLLASLQTSAQSNWARRIGSWSNDAFNSIVIDNSGNTYVAGEFGGVIELGTSTLISAGSMDIIVARYDPAGQLVWHRNFGSTGLDRGVDLVLNTSG